MIDQNRNPWSPTVASDKVYEEKNVTEINFKIGLLFLFNLVHVVCYGDKNLSVNHKTN